MGLKDVGRALLCILVILVLILAALIVGQFSGRYAIGGAPRKPYNPNATQMKEIEQTRVLRDEWALHQAAFAKNATDPASLTADEKEALGYIFTPAEKRKLKVALTPAEEATLKAQIAAAKPTAAQLAATNVATAQKQTLAERQEKNLKEIQENIKKTPQGAKSLEILPICETCATFHWYNHADATGNPVNLVPSFQSIIDGMAGLVAQPSLAELWYISAQASEAEARGVGKNAADSLNDSKSMLERIQKHEYFRLKPPAMGATPTEILEARNTYKEIEDLCVTIAEEVDKATKALNDAKGPMEAAKAKTSEVIAAKKKADDVFDELRPLAPPAPLQALPVAASAPPPVATIESIVKGKASEIGKATEALAQLDPSIQRTRYGKISKEVQNALIKTIITRLSGYIPASSGNDAETIANSAVNAAKTSVENNIRVYSNTALAEDLSDPSDLIDPSDPSFGTVKVQAANNAVDALNRAFADATDAIKEALTPPPLAVGGARRARRGVRGGARVHGGAPGGIVGGKINPAAKEPAVEALTRINKVLEDAKAALVRIDDASAGGDPVMTSNKPIAEGLVRDLENIVTTNTLIVEVVKNAATPAMESSNQAEDAVAKSITMYGKVKELQGMNGRLEQALNQKLKTIQSPGAAPKASTGPGPGATSAARVKLPKDIPESVATAVISAVSATIDPIVAALSGDKNKLINAIVSKVYTNITPAITNPALDANQIAVSASALAETAAKTAIADEAAKISPPPTSDAAFNASVDAMAVAVSSSTLTSLKSIADSRGVNRSGTGNSPPGPLLMKIDDARSSYIKLGQLYGHSSILAIPEANKLETYLLTKLSPITALEFPMPQSRIVEAAILVVEIGNEIRGSNSIGTSQLTRITKVVSPAKTSPADDFFDKLVKDLATLLTPSTSPLTPSPISYPAGTPPWLKTAAGGVQTGVTTLAQTNTVAYPEWIGVKVAQAAVNAVMDDSAVVLATVAAASTGDPLKLANGADAERVANLAGAAVQALLAAQISAATPAEVSTIVAPLVDAIKTELDPGAAAPPAAAAAPAAAPAAAAPPPAAAPAAAAAAALVGGALPGPSDMYWRRLDPRGNYVHPSPGPTPPTLAIDGAAGPAPTLLVASSDKELDERLRRGGYAAGGAVYAIVIDRPGDRTALLRAAASNLRMRLPSEYIGKTVNMRDGATGWLYAIRYVGPDFYRDTREYLRPEMYAA